jgi:hypothetical protein
VSSHSGGVKLGDRIARLVSQAIVYTYSRMVGAKHTLAMTVFHSISDTISAENHHTLDPIIGMLHEAYGEDKPASKALEFMHNQTGQLQALAGSTLLSQGLLWPISGVLNNELAPVVYEAVATNPHSIPDSGSIAQMGAREWIDGNSYRDGMAKNGLNDAWAQALLQMNQSYPDTSTAIDLVRRGKITEDDFANWLAHNGTPRGLSGVLLSLADTPLSPADAALAELRGNIQHAEGVAAAAAYGVSEHNYNVLIGNTGEPPGVMQLLEARRRDFIDDATLVKGILESRVRNEWIPTLEKLAYSPMSVADAVDALVQNNLTYDQASLYAKQNGLEPGHFDPLVATAGEPLSRTEMEQLFNRGKATEDQVKQALRESRLKNKYVDDAFLLHERLLEPRELGDAVVYGSLTHQQAIQEAMYYGYTQDRAEVVVSAAINRKLETQRMAVVRAVETLYENNAISQDLATSIAGQMGFEPTEAAFIFQAAEFRRQEKLIAAGVSAVRSKYVAHHIDKTTASGLLDAIQIPHQQRDSMLQVWQIEHDANVRLLTPAQIVKAGALGIFQPDEVMTRLTDLGYSDVDANALVNGA